ncbi:hypothetical protein ACFL08_02350 [Patescibacteria group bacterium]
MRCVMFTEATGGIIVGAIGLAAFLAKRYIPQIKIIAEDKLGKDWDKKTWTEFVFNGPLIGVGSLIWLPDSAYMFVFKLIFLFGLFVWWRTLDKKGKSNAPIMK